MGAQLGNVPDCNIVEASSIFAKCNSLGQWLPQNALSHYLESLPSPQESFTENGEASRSHDLSDQQ